VDHTICQQKHQAKYSDENYVLHAKHENKKIKEAQKEKERIY
jgi:hypothetical protein